MNDPITFKANIVAYPESDMAAMTMWQTKKLLDSGKYSIEFVMPINEEPSIIIRPKVKDITNLTMKELDRQMHILIENFLKEIAQKEVVVDPHPY
jgi:hypothetical protein